MVISNQEFEVIELIVDVQNCLQVQFIFILSWFSTVHLDNTVFSDQKDNIVSHSFKHLRRHLLELILIWIPLLLHSEAHKNTGISEKTSSFLCMTIITANIRVEISGHGTGVFIWFKGISDIMCLWFSNLVYKQFFMDVSKLICVTTFSVIFDANIIHCGDKITRPLIKILQPSTLASSIHIRTQISFFHPHTHTAYYFFDTALILKFLIRLYDASSVEM